MNELANMIQKVINTLQGIDIKASYDNVNHMMGVYGTLAQVREELLRQENGQEPEVKMEVVEDGDVDAE